MKSGFLLTSSYNQIAIWSGRFIVINKNRRTLFSKCSSSWIYSLYINKVAGFFHCLCGEQNRVDALGEPCFSSPNGFESGSAIRNHNDDLGVSDICPFEVSSDVLIARGSHVKLDTNFLAEIEGVLSGYVRKTHQILHYCSLSLRKRQCV
ncbi:hypothetical protein TNCV_955501 [Trichonephila clavipes]|nr:hypothetical protein TNCV_955501 [Trichonephila clavipes]